MPVLGISHVHFFVEHLQKWQNWFHQCLGFSIIHAQHDRHTEWAILGQGKVIIHISAPLNLQSPVAQYFSKHPEGLAEIAFICEEQMPTLTINNIRHKFIKSNPYVALDYADQLFTKVDHIVVNVPKGEMQSTTQWYHEHLDLIWGDRFHIQTKYSGLESVVMHNSDYSVQIPINEPTNHNSQIQEFLDHHGGAGVQHLALQTNDIYRTVAILKQKGVDFLDTEPPILVESQAQGRSLLQIFTKPLFAQPTFFLEIIERRSSAIGFGEGNFQNLFIAMEKQQQSRQ
jgi:4-hydroxyphenylpyruvate dioxygenase